MAELFDSPILSTLIPDLFRSQEEALQQNEHKDVSTLLEPTVLMLAQLKAISEVFNEGCFLGQLPAFGIMFSDKLYAAGSISYRAFHEVDGNVISVIKFNHKVLRTLDPITNFLQLAGPMAKLWAYEQCNSQNFWSSDSNAAFEEVLFSILDFIGLEQNNTGLENRPIATGVDINPNGKFADTVTKLLEAGGDIEWFVPEFLTDLGLIIRPEIEEQYQPEKEETDDSDDSFGGWLSL